MEIEDALAASCGQWWLYYGMDLIPFESGGGTVGHVDSSWMDTELHVEWIGWMRLKEPQYLVVT